MPDKTMYSIETQISRCGLLTSALNFRVTCKEVPEDDLGDATKTKDVVAGASTEIKGAVVAELTGFAAPCLGFDELPFEGSLFDEFDCRDGDVHQGYSLLQTEHSTIDTLFDYPVAETCSKIVMLEMLTVKPEVRGHRLGLRLMREVQQIFEGIHTVGLLLAAPQEDKESVEAQRGLIDYYLSDPALGFKEVNYSQYPGWMAACWTGNDLEPDDEAFFFLRSRD